MTLSNSYKKLVGIAALVLALALIGFYALPKLGQDTQEPLSMRVGYLPLLVNLPLFTALENGYFDKYGLTVEAVEAQSPNHIVEGIISGSLDGAGVLAYPILFAAEEKSPGEIKIFFSGDETEEEFVASILVRNDSEISSIEDLKGKKIGVYTGLVQVLFLKAILTGMGLDPEKDVIIEQIEPRLQLQGLQAGHYEVLSTVEPFPTIAVSQGLAKVLVENPRVKYVQNPFPSVATAISAEFLEKNPKATRAYLRAYRDAISFIRSNPEKAKSYLVKYTPTPEAVAPQVRLLKFSQIGEEDRVGVQQFADWMFQVGLLKKQTDVNSMFGDPAVLEGRK